MRDTLRRWLNRLVEPTHITGKHVVGVPQKRFVDFWPLEWADAQWAEIAERHDIKGDDDGE